MTPDFNPSPLKLLYLGFAFPPGVQALFPGVNPAGHALETQMIGQLRHDFDIRSAGVLPCPLPRLGAVDPSSGIDHEVLLLDKAPEVFHRLRSLARLKAAYRSWLRSGWRPDFVLVYNLSPIYNGFLRWLQRQPGCPRLVLLLLDSAHLGHRLPAFKRFRYRFKPLATPDSEMLPLFDACIGLSREVERHFSPLGIPFYWMPGGCAPSRALREPEFAGFGTNGQPTRFGYFGALGAHAGVRLLVDTFLSIGGSARLEVCGYGKGASELAAIAAREPRFKFHGLLSPEECLRFGRACDVLVNPRPATHGNENNFASKLFDYALSGRAILTSRLSGVEEVLGPQAEYFEANDFASSLKQHVAALAATPRAELARRGAAIQQRVLSRFSWEHQAAGMAAFLREIGQGQSAVEVAQALAA